MCHAQAMPSISFLSWRPPSSSTPESAATNLTPPTSPTTRIVPSVLKQRKKPELLQHNLFTIDPEPDPFDAASLYSAPSLLSLHSTIEGGSSRHEEERNMVRTFWDLSLIPRNANMYWRESMVSFLHKYDVIEIGLKQKGNILHVKKTTMRSTFGVYDIQLPIARYMQ